jgi:hypothetical protein
MSNPPPVPSPKTKMSGKTKGCLGCLGISVIGFIALFIIGWFGSQQDKKDFERDRDKIMSDMQNAAAAGEHRKVVEIGGRYESVADYDFKKVLGESNAKVYAEEAAEREQAAKTAAEKKEKDAASERAAKAEAARPAAVGDTVKFKDSEWVVIEARDLGQKLRGGNFSEPKNTEGKFIYIRFKVTNTTNEEEAILFTPGIKDSKGRKYEEMDDTALYLKDNEESMTLEQLPASLPKTFSSIFEVPTDATGIEFLARDFAAFGTQEKAISLGF